MRLHANGWLTARPGTHTPKCALVLLNTPPRPATALRQLWALSSYRVCADAAANRLRDSLQQSMGEDRYRLRDSLRRMLHEQQHVASQHESMVPDVVTGDFDSIRPDVLDFYRERGCVIAHDPDQGSTDFDKALRVVERAQAATRRAAAGGGGGGGAGGASGGGGGPSQEEPKWTVAVFGAFGDRFDHEMASINVLHRYRGFARLLLLGERMTACLLEPGKHRLLPNPAIEGPTCGLLPIGGRCDAVWTSGLRWNLRGEPLEFGGMVSSSNQMLCDEESGRMEVTVETTQPLVWTTVLRPDGWPRTHPDGFSIGTVDRAPKGEPL